MVFYHQTKQRNKFLFVNSFSPEQKVALEKYSQMVGHEVQPLLLFDTKKAVKPWLEAVEPKIILRVDITDTNAIQTALKPYEDAILSATCLGESNVPHLRKVIPLLPYCNLPTEKSLEWSTEKLKMRSLLRNYDKSIAPNFLVISDATTETIEKIEKRLDYPVVVKPSGLAASLLVSICYHREELEKVLRQTMRKLEQLYKANNRSK